MAQESSKAGENARPLLNRNLTSVHPGLHPSVTNVPVTPGIDNSAYQSGSSGAEDSYFGRNIHKGGNTMAAQSPTEAASGARSNQVILRRMSMGGSSMQRRDSLFEIDPRAANPSLSLSGGIISATFCIPFSLKHRKGQDWVCTSRSLVRAC
jgi:trehalose 6-phosphate synthase/phosphatase